MVSFILFYLVGIPVSVLLHEIGHALGVLIFTKKKAHVYLGPVNDDNKKNFQIGRMHFHIKWAFFGFCTVNNRSELTNFKWMIFLAGGPTVTLLLVIGAYLLPAEGMHYGTQNFLNGIFYSNLCMFIFTSVPIIYPRWLGPYAGRPSDGYQILRILKPKKEFQ